uniref:Uncharacterized protein n=1 Tax=Oryza nivara TaxID=4536 RepID=A0A0E0J0Y2_ORYNI
MAAMILAPQKAFIHQISFFFQRSGVSFAEATKFDPSTSSMVIPVKKVFNNMKSNLRFSNASSKKYVHDRLSFDVPNRTFAFQRLDVPRDSLEFSKFLDPKLPPIGCLIDYWQEGDVILGRVILRAYFDDVDMVPRRIVIKEINQHSGQGESWAFGVFVLNNEFVDAQPPYEDLPPVGPLGVQTPNNNQPNAPFDYNDHVDKANHDNLGNWEQHDNQQATGNSGVSSNSDLNGVLQLKSLDLVRFVDSQKACTFSQLEEHVEPSTPLQLLLYPLKLPLRKEMMGVEMCGLHLEDVAESKLQGEKLKELPSPTEDAE